MIQLIRLARKIEGLQTISSIRRKLGISRSTAVKYVHFLKKQGFVEKIGGGKQPRMYKISAFKQKKIGNPGLYDIINKYSPIKIRAVSEKIIGKKLSIEEAIIRAVLTKDYRTILASLILFNHVKNWPYLYKLARDHNIRRKIGALYETAKQFIRVRKIDEKTRNLLLNAQHENKSIVKGLKSDDFQDIEKIWRVYIPFNRKDLLRLKE